jgi:hypothetical protein
VNESGDKFEVQCYIGGTFFVSRKLFAASSRQNGLYFRYGLAKYKIVSKARHFEQKLRRPVPMHELEALFNGNIQGYFSPRDGRASLSSP